MKILYASVLSTLIIGALCLVIDPHFDISPQAVPQKSLGYDQPLVPGNSRLRYCPRDGQEDLLKILHATTTPYLPQRGQNFYIDIVGLKLGPTMGAKLTVSGQVGERTIFQTQKDLCTDPGTRILCLVEMGPLTVRLESEIPWNIPPIDFSLRIQAQTYDQRDIFCMDLV
ncbi:putative phosphatidylglycerol phosphatidylinositol transfer protein [Golovinomyces cichoracearum]|uniref:Phosphatidylglycerol/phosphatidylinositol transfer protein n=1 Tax=Golovinomyces cichoracearum TaxID=62708 RepID=A0A420I0H6_9PEZI|nr:putative phosphatidylglycerol phosphatidylinositol transfer protein [Golovinomyces cichoracearum]